jgi:hypothetical protein
VAKTDAGGTERPGRRHLVRLDPRFAPEHAAYYLSGFLEHFGTRDLPLTRNGFPERYHDNKPLGLRRPARLRRAQDLHRRRRHARARPCRARVGGRLRQGQPRSRPRAGRIRGLRGAHRPEPRPEAVVAASLVGRWRGVPHAPTGSSAVGGSTSAGSTCRRVGGSNTLHTSRELPSRVRLLQRLALGEAPRSQRSSRRVHARVSGTGAGRPFRGGSPPDAATTCPSSRT